MRLRDLRHRSLMCSAVIQPSRNTTPRTKSDFPQGHEPADALRNVTARQCRSRDVLNIRLEPKLVELLPPGELVPPRVAAHLATVAFPISEHLESSQPPRRIDSRSVGDEVLPTDHLIDKDIPEQL